MRRLPAIGSGVLALTLLLTTFTQTGACCKELAISISPVQQATHADIVVIGKVTDLDPDLVMIEQYKGSGLVGHMVANVRIEESLLGAKGLTHVRIGFIPGIRYNYGDDLAAFQFQRLGGQRSWRGPVNLDAGQEACFMLQKHHSGDFYTLQQHAYPLDKSELNYESELKGVRSILKAFNKPVEALQVKDAAERQLAACALVMRYRTQKNQYVPVTVVNEPIAADESKLILQALSEMKWGELPFDPNGTFSLQNAFYQLGLPLESGWQQPQQKENENYNEVMTKAFSTWAKANADKYRIQRLVAKPQSAQ